jgi:glycosyltransferase involved in cell wall biosynthesis
MGGALSILKDVYRDIEINYDNTNKYIFVVGNIHLADTKRITVCKFPWVHKNWIYRVYFDLFVAHRLVKKYKIHSIISYQNMTVPLTKVPQTLYLQQSLPFITKKFTFRESKWMWLYQNVICKFVVKSLKEASKIIVQTQWMKRACIEKYNVPAEKIEIQPPKICIDSTCRYSPISNGPTTFFYPASELIYKNHQTIVNACLKLNLQNVQDYRVIFTLEGKENGHISKLKKVCKDNRLNIEFVGRLNREKVYDMYSKSVLVFPSYIETFGLPLLEAKLVGAPIIAADMPFSHEILNDYNKISYFEAFDSDKLAELMGMYIKGEVAV